MVAIPDHGDCASEERDGGEQTDGEVTLNSDLLNDGRGPEGDGRIAADDAEVDKRAKPDARVGECRLETCLLADSLVLGGKAGRHRPSHLWLQPRRIRGAIREERQDGTTGQDGRDTLEDEQPLPVGES